MTGAGNFFKQTGVEFPGGREDWQGAAQVAEQCGRFVADDEDYTWNHVKLV